MNKKDRQERFNAEAIYAWFMERTFTYSHSDNVQFKSLSFCGLDVLTDEDYLKAKEDK